MKQEGMTRGHSYQSQNIQQINWHKQKQTQTWLVENIWKSTNN
jgi:hypothetical protein